MPARALTVACYKLSSEMNWSPSPKPPPVDVSIRERLIESLVRLERFANHVEPDHVVFRDEFELMASLARRLPQAEVAEIVLNSGELGGAYLKWLETAPFCRGVGRHPGPGSGNGQSVFHHGCVHQISKASGNPLRAVSSVGGGVLSPGNVGQGSTRITPS